MAYGMGGIVPFPTNSADAKLQMGKLLKRACQYCGAASGEPCKSRTGLILTSIGQVHEARLTSSPLGRSSKIVRRS